MNNNYHLLISKRLNNIINNNYILLDLPYYGNVGDVLIWQSTLDLLKNIKYKCLYSASIETYKKPKIDKKIIIIFMGGGNFGDLWERHQLFRYKVMNDFPNNPLLQLPQSVWFENNDKLQYDINIFAKHKGSITICTRDEKSFNIIKENYQNVNTLLLPDLALCFNAIKYCIKHKIKIIKGEGALLLKRNDKEAIPINPIETNNAEDWPTLNQESIDNQIKLNKWLNILEKLHLGRFRQTIINWYYRKIVKDRIIIQAILFLLPYKTIYSTRLHGGILAYLLHKETYLVDNSYHKNKGVYNLWLKDKNGINMI